MQIYLTFRQLGASLGVAFLTILLEWRETLHSSRLYEHLNAANQTTSTAMSSISRFLYTNSGMSTAGPQLTPIGLVARAGAHQVEALSYADCFLFMAMVGVLAVFFIPLMAPFLAPSKERRSSNPQ
jgi:DHA2 family multidrug resistance protein